MQVVAGDGIAGIKQCRRDLSSDGVKNMETTSGCGRLKEDLESSTWRWRQDYKVMPSHQNLYKYKSIFRVLVCNFGIILYNPRETNPSRFRYVSWKKTEENKKN
nr:hypothetical protein [Tanacetum cinerariifolium]